MNQKHFWHHLLSSQFCPVNLCFDACFLTMLQKLIFTKIIKLIIFVELISIMGKRQKKLPTLTTFQHVLLSSQFCSVNLCFDAHLLNFTKIIKMIIFCRINCHYAKNIPTRIIFWHYLLSSHFCAVNLFLLWCTLFWCCCKNYFFQK